MTARESAPATPADGPAATTVPAPTRRNYFGWGLLALALLIIGLVAAHARRGAVSDRIRNPEVTGVPRPVEPLFGFDHWIDVIHIGTVCAVLVVIVVWVRMFRRNPRDPVLLMGFMTTMIVWQDPIMNWAPFAVYNPELWHWPEDWPLVSLSPTVEPFVVFGYVLFYLGPYFPAIWLLRRFQARRAPDSFVWKHPLIALALLILPIGFLFDMILEVSLVRTGMYIYSQAIPFGTLFAGSTYQFPLLWESLSVTFVMIPAGVLIYRDDTGRTVAEKLALRARIFTGRPFAGMVLMMFVVMNLSYFTYGGWFAVIKWTRSATSVACPWPYPEAKVYDPQGFYEQNGAPGPYSVGIWSTWMSAQPDGRPDATPPADGGRCGEAK